MDQDTILLGEKRPFHIMAKAAGAECNMRCDYCYYLEKDKLYRPSKGPRQPSPRLSDELLELYIRQYIEAQPRQAPVVFTWHGGEALIRPRSFYQRALELQQRYGQGRRIENTLQTNGLLVNEDWCRFFRDHDFLIGLSLDGYQEQHDAYRRTVGGLPTFERVMRAVDLMQRLGVEFNILSTVNTHNADDPEGYYRFMKGIGVRYIQFTPIVERIDESCARKANFVEAPYIHASAESREMNGLERVRLAPYSITPEQWGSFTTGVFDEWIREDVGEVFVQLFDSTLAGWMGVEPGVCTLGKVCGHAGVMEHNGDVYSCDHYVYPRYLLGNIRQRSLSEMMNSSEQYRFGRAKLEGLTKQCLECEYLFACNGECPKNRFAQSSDGEWGHNYLCSGYYRFWSHVAPYMDYMKQCLLQGLPASQVMRAHISRDS